MFNYEIYSVRRQKIFDQMKDNSVLVLPPNPLSTWSNDTDNTYRPNSDILYLTGYPEHECVVFLVKNGDRKFYMSVLPRDPDKETWTGRRFGPEGVKNVFHADDAFPENDLSSKMLDYFRNAYTIYYNFGLNTLIDEKVLHSYNQSRSESQRKFVGPREIIDPNPFIHNLRLIKTQEEIAIIKRACDISSKAHIAAMKAIKPGMTEYQIQSIVEHEFLMFGGRHPAYNSICGSGENGTILHYVQNSATLHTGELFLIDAATEYEHYCADITRTYPINGEFTPIQRRVYEIVLEAQKQGIEFCKPNNTFQSIHDKVLEVLTQGLIDLGILKGELTQLIKDEKYKPYYMHRTSHWLGLDVHDVGFYAMTKNHAIQSITLQPGMILTVEPGLYFQPTIPNLPEEFKGIGVRIEDDFLITENGCINLTESTPKLVSELESIVGSNYK